MPRLAGFPTDVTIRFDGEEVPARTGEPIASALLAAGRILLSRSPKYHRPRGPFCLAGSCGGCLVRVDGQPSRRACRVRCRDGLTASSQNALPSARRDLLGAVDILTPRGFDHHRLATWSGVANRAAVALSRRLAGVGRLPDDVPSPAAEPPREERFDALVVGAGPAGLAAAEALAEAGRRVLVADEDAAAGGRLRGELGALGEPDLRWAAAVVARVRASGGEAALGASVVGCWRDGGAPLAVLEGTGEDRMRLVRAGRIVLCLGGHPQPPSIGGGDRPGVLAARGVAALLAEHGVVPGARAALIGEGPEEARLADRLRQAGIATEVVAPGEPVRIVGHRRVRALALGRRRIACDTVLIGGPPAPATELARALGAAVRLDLALEAHAVDADLDGRTGVPELFAAGEVTGPADASTAAERGRRAGKAARG